MSEVVRLNARIVGVRVEGATLSPFTELVLRCEMTEAIAELVRSVGADCTVGLVIEPGTIPAALHF